MHNRLPGARSTAPRGAWSTRYERDHPTRGSSSTRARATRGRRARPRYESANFPGDETTDWSRSLGPRLARDRTCSTAASAAPTASAPTSAATSTSARTSRRRRSCSSAGPSGRRCRRCSACTARSARARTRRGRFDARDRAPLQRAARGCTSRARPLILRLWREAVRTGIPIARPLWLAYPRRRRGRAAGPGVAARPRRAGRAGRRRRARASRERLLPARLLASAGDAAARFAAGARRRVERAARDRCRTSSAAGRGRSRVPSP